jgi:hypothetical protein
MDDTRSFIKTVIARIRGYLDDPDFDAKYTDQFLVKHVVMPCLVDVWSRVSLSADNPVMLDFNLTFVENQECYVLPPCVGEIHEIVQYTGLDGRQLSNGLITDDLRPSHPQSRTGPVWMIEGNMICFRPFPQNLDSGGNTNLTWTVRYTTNGDMMPFYSGLSAYGSLDNTNKTTFTFSANTPELGLIDTRPSAYVGQFLRLLSTNDPNLPVGRRQDVVEERVITAYDPNTRTVTVARPFTVGGNATGYPVSPTSSFLYEICPPQSQGMVEAIAIAAALKLGAWRKISQAQNQLLTQQYRSAIKTIGDNLANMNLRTGKGWSKDTRDNPRWRP